MPLHNTERLTAARVLAANTGLYSLKISPGEKNDIASFFGVGVRTVQRWFADTAAGDQRRCIPRFAYNSYPLIENPDDPDGAPISDTRKGHRINRMIDADNPSGEGGAFPESKGGGDLQHMRYRCYLAACLGLEGLDREPIYTGKSRVEVLGAGSLGEALENLNIVWTGNYHHVVTNGWWLFRVERKTGGGWNTIVFYNDPKEGEYYDEEKDEPDPPVEEIAT